MGLKANADGSGAIQVGGSDAISITSGLNTTFAGTVQAGGIATALYPLVRGTAQTSTSGTAIDFTGIPSWVDRITVMFSGVSLSGTSPFLFQLGTSGGVVTSGYAGGGMRVGGSTVAAASYTAGFSPSNATAAATYGGNIVFTNVSANIWSASGVFGTSGGVESAAMTGGSISLGGTLDRIRITTINGTDTFDAGSINILYE